MSQVTFLRVYKDKQIQNDSSRDLSTWVREILAEVSSVLKATVHQKIVAEVFQKIKKHLLSNHK